MFDLIIIGAGPIGLACSIEAKKKKLMSLILEKGVLVNSIYNYPQNMTFFSTSDKLEIGEVPFMGCGELEEINVDFNNKYYSSISGVLFSNNKGISSITIFLFLYFFKNNFNDFLIST